MCWWRRMEKISVTDDVRSEEVSQSVKKERNIVQTMKWRTANWTGQILRTRNIEI
jgi:hypothetical protein